MNRIDIKIKIAYALFVVVLFFAITAFIMFVITRPGDAQPTIKHASETTPSQSPSEQPKVKIEQDPELLAMAKQLGIDTSDINLKYDDNVLLDNQDIVGSYDSNAGERGLVNTGTIILQHRVQNKLRTLAHEYMHYVWAKKVQFANYADNLRKDLSRLLDIAYDNSTFLQDKMDWYASNMPKYDKYSELEAYACAEVDPSILPAKLNDWCDKWLPNRQILF